MATIILPMPCEKWVGSTLIYTGGSGFNGKIDDDKRKSDKGDKMTDVLVMYRGTVYPWQCDHMGHMNVMFYAGKFDEATWQLLATLGLSGKRIRDERIAMVAVEQHTEYKRELVAGDLVRIESSVLEIREKGVVFAHEMFNEETQELAARTVLTGVCIDAATRKARPLPDVLAGVVACK